MIMKTIFLIAILSLVACNNDPMNKDRVLSEDDKSEINAINKLADAEGLHLLKMNCYSCHNPESESHDNMLSPPLAATKYRYKQVYPDKDMFVAQMADFLENPTEENSLMPRPVKRFGIMPKSILSKKEIQELTLFIYENEVEIPGWFPEHFEEEHGFKWADR